MATNTKGTRKTYSFEEREILMKLITKYEDVEEKKSDPISTCKRKSAWAKVTEEYNCSVGPQGARSCLQLRRCWENMKSCKRNRDGRFICNQKSKESEENLSNTDQKSTIQPNNGSLPPNIVFEPKESEPFTLKSVNSSVPLKARIKKELNKTPSDLMEMTDQQGSSKNGLNSEIQSLSDNEEDVTYNDKISWDWTVDSHGSDHEMTKLPSRNVDQDKFQTNDDQLQLLLISEARIKVDVATMLKEEAQIKLEEAHYRKEEAKLRMLIFNYKLDKMKQS